MRSRTRYLLVIIVCAALIFCQNTYAAKKRIAVMPFANTTQYSWELFGGGLTDSLLTELVKSRTYEVVERNRLNAVLQEQRLGATGIIDPATAAQIGQILGVDYLLSGSIIYAGIDDSRLFATRAKVTVAVQLVDTRTGRIIFADQLNGFKSPGAIRQEYARGRYRYNMNLPAARIVFSEAAHRAVRKLINTLYEVNPLEGYVIAVEKNTVIIDLGREHGVAPKQRFLIYREGAPIYHPVHNTLVALRRTDIATCRVRLAEATVAYCNKINFIGDGDDITPGDKVRLLTTR